MKKLSVVLLTMLFILGMATAAFAAQTGLNSGDADVVGSAYYTSKFSAPLTSVDQDNNIGDGNANLSGSGVTTNDGSTLSQVIKSDNVRMNDKVTTGVQKTHGSYQNNTNSCASCHQTHTGAAKDLLFKSSVYATCTACHDGTLGFYNVFANGADASTAGTFGGTKMGNASVHLATGAFAVTIAPGGKSGVAMGTDKTSRGVAWGQAFDCAACHAPHGSFSDRLLHYNPNFMGATKPEDGGRLVDRINVITGALPAANANTPEFYAWRTTAGDLSGTGHKAFTKEDAGTTVMVLVYKSGSNYRVSTDPWLYGYYSGSPRQYWTTLYTGANRDSLTKVQSNHANETAAGVAWYYGYGYMKGGSVGTATYMDVARPYIVKLQSATKPMTEVDLGGGWKYTKVDNSIYMSASNGDGIAISRYCSACHTDYMATASTTPEGGSGTFSKAYRHTTNSDSYTCLKCHYAHGTDVSVMMDAENDTVATLVGAGVPQADAEAYMLDQNPSSALKRYTNMTVCWRCHTGSKAEQLKNNKNYWDNYDTVPHGW